MAIKNIGKPWKWHHRHRAPLFGLLLLVGVALAYLRTANLLATLTKRSEGPPQLILPEPSRTRSRANATRADGRGARGGEGSSVGRDDRNASAVTEGGGPAPPPTPALATAVLVETRCHPAFSVALHGAVRHLGPEVPIVVVHSPHNAAFVRGAIAAIPELADARPRIALRETNESAWGAPCPERRGERCGIYSTQFWYSRMFVSLRFWEAFATPYVLTLQSDTLLCRPFPTQELVEHGASFTGGISGMQAGFKPYTPAANPRHGVVLNHGEYLNGGASFRNVRWVKDCIRKHQRPEGWIEDELYRTCREDADLNGTVYETEVGAYAFSSDNGKTLCFEDPTSSRGNNRTCPLCVHKPWTEGSKKRAAAAYAELQQNCPGLERLQELNLRKLQRGETCLAYDATGGAPTTFRCQCGR